MALSMHPGLIGAAVLCFALTVAFASGVYSKSGDLARLRDGDTTRPNADTVPKLLEQRAVLRRETAGREFGHLRARGRPEQRKSDQRESDQQESAPRGKRPVHSPAVP